MGKRSKHAAAALLAVSLFVAGFGGTGLAEEKAPTEKVPEPRGAHYPDAQDPSVGMSYHDAVEAYVDAYDGAMHVWVRLARPWVEGIATGVDVYVDCDNDPGTGARGFELRTRACVGSRTRPNEAGARRPGLPSAFGIRLSGHCVLMGGDSRANTGEFVWAGTGSVKRPLVRGDLLYFSFPLKLLKENGTRYNETVRLSIRVDGTHAEDPIWLEYLCADEGVEIRVDGADDDWTGGPRTVDDVGEIHPVMEHLDLRDLQVDHDGSSLFARIRLKSPGFEVPRGRADVIGRDVITLVVEPLGGGDYMKLKEIRLYGGAAARTGTDYAWHVADGVAEVRVARPAAQTRLRVMVWTEATRWDYIGDAQSTFAFAIPGAAWVAR